MPGHSAGGPELRQRLRPSTGLVRGDAARLPDHADPGRKALGSLRVGVALLRVLGQASRDQVTGHAVSEVVREAVQLGPGFGIELVGADRIRNMRAALTRLVRRDRAAGGRTPAPLVRPGPRPSAAGSFLRPVACPPAGWPWRLLAAAVMTTVATAVPRRSLPGAAASRPRGHAILAAGGPIRRTTSSGPGAPAASATLVTARRPASTIPGAGAGTASTGPLAGAVGISVRGLRSASVGAGARIARPGRLVTSRGSVAAFRPPASVIRRRGTVVPSRCPAIASAVALRPTRPAG